MIPLVEQAPFVVGVPELVFTVVPVLIILAIVGPRFLRERRKK